MEYCNMSEEKVLSVLEIAYQSLVTEATEALVKVLNDAEVDVGKDFIDRIKEQIYDSLIMKVE